MKIIQVTNQDGDHVALYSTDRTDDKVLDDVEKCFEMAKQIADLDKGIDEHDAADTYLEDKGISREFADEVFVNL